MRGRVCYPWMRDMPMGGTSDGESVGVLKDGRNGETFNRSDSIRCWNW